MKQFKIRASASGKIMGIKALGKTGESYLQEWLKEQIYSRKKEFSNKYTLKGLLVEDWSLDFISDQLGIKGCFKNDEYFENDYFAGSPDVVLEDCIIDVKNSWDAFTFPLFDTEIPNSDYYFQGQIYMALTGKKHYKLIYTLLDTPMDIIQKEAFFFARDNGLELNEELINEFRERNSFSSIDPKYRIKVFEFEYDQPTIDKLISRVEESRIYLSTLPI
jgi:hypothetical protein